MRILMNKQQSRRLASLAKVADSIILILSQNSTVFLVDNVEFFKAVKFKEPGSEDMQVYNVDPKLVTAVCVDEGYLNINIKESKINFTYTNKEGKDLVSASGTVSVTPKSIIADIYNFINPLGYAPLKIYALDMSKLLIELCAATNNNLVISPDIITTTSTSLKVFINTQQDKGVKNPIGLTPTALKEIERFKLDCSVYDMANYLILYKPGFILGVRKAILKNVDFIPPQYYSDSGVLLAAKLDFRELGNFLANIAPKLLKVDSSCKCILNIEEGVIKVDLGSQTYKFELGISNVIDKADGPQTIVVSLQDILNAKNIITSTASVNMSVYKNILRIDASNINVLMRWGSEFSRK